MMKKVIGYIVVLHLSLIGIAYAEEAGSISGRINDSRGRPVANAKVSVAEKSDFTDDDGHYRIRGVVAGKHKLRVEKGSIKGEDDIEVTNISTKKDLSLGR